MTNPTYIAADAILVLMFTVPAWDADDAARLARFYTAKGFVTEVTTALFNGVMMTAVDAYAIADGDAKALAKQEAFYEAEQKAWSAHAEREARLHNPNRRRHYEMVAREFEVRTRDRRRP